MNCRGTFLVAAMVAATFGGSAKALCLDGKLSPSEELKQSQWVGTAVLVADSPVTDPDDPAGVAATRYDFSARTLYKGRKRHFSVWVDNTSSRIVFERGTTYLLFVQQQDGRGFVDGCGNSGPERESAVMLKWLRSTKGKAQ